MEYTKEQTRKILNEIKVEHAYKLTKEEIDDAKKNLRAYKDNGKKIVEYFDELNDLYDIKENKVHGLRTGVAVIDENIGVLKNKELMVLGGAPSAGKSLIATNIMAKLIQEGKNVIYVSLEMGFGSVFERLASVIDLIDPSFFNGKFEDKNKISTMRNRLTDFAIKMSENKHWQILTMEDFETPSCENVIATCKALSKHLGWNNIDLVIIDYLQYMPIAQGKTEYENTNDVVQQLKTFVVTEKIPVLALSSLSSEGNLKGSTSIKFTCDFAIMVNPIEGTDDRCIAVVKNRRGSCGKHKIAYSPYLRILEGGRM